jgi:hypothetical protein
MIVGVVTLIVLATVATALLWNLAADYSWRRKR